MTETGPTKSPQADAPAEESCDWRPRAEIAHNIAQAAALKEQAAKGGLVFEAYLPPAQALWLLSLIEQRKYADPADALFNLLGEAQDLAPHEDLRKELLKRTLDAALMPGETVPIEACIPDMRARMEGPQPEPAVWQEWQSEKSGDQSGDPSGAEDASG